MSERDLLIEALEKNIAEMRQEMRELTSFIEGDERWKRKGVAERVNDLEKRADTCEEMVEALRTERKIDRAWLKGAAAMATLAGITGGGSVVLQFVGGG